MEKQIYKIKNSEITFDNESIVIKDDAKKLYWIFIAKSILWIVYAITSILRYQKTGDKFLLWTGLIFGIGFFVILIRTLFKSTKSEIKKSEIISIQLKHRLSNKFLELKLTGNKIRRVTQIDSIYDELDAYIKTNFKDRNNEFN